MVQQISQAGTNVQEAVKSPKLVSANSPNVTNSAVKPVSVNPRVAVQPQVESPGESVEEPSIWSKWWVWVIIGVVFLGVVVGAYILFS